MARAPIDPNVITTIRLPLAPLVVVFLVTGTLWGTVVAAFLAVILEVTDLLDGWIARRYGIVTDFGALYDPFSDAFCRYTVFLGLYAIGVADLWMVIAIFYRDSAISFFRTVAANRNVVLGARWSGKAKALVQGFGTQIIFGFLVLHHLFPTWPISTLPWWTMLLITLLTIASFVDYFVGTWRVLADAWANKPVG